MMKSHFQILHISSGLFLLHRCKTLARPVLLTISVSSTSKDTSSTQTFICSSPANVLKGRMMGTQSQRAGVHHFRRATETNYLTRYSSFTDASASNSSVDKEEIAKFSRMANIWWKEGGELKALHSLNKLRIPLIKDALLQQNDINTNDLHPIRPLTGFKILDVGSGGGILSEPLARLGASVTGVEASEENVKIAKAHASQDSALSNNLKYERSTVEDLDQKEERFDAVVASEVVEHVGDNITFVQACCQLVKPGGSVIFTTISQTYLAYALGVFAAERIFNVVPPGTHDWNKFLSPQDLQYMIEQNRFNTRIIHGMFYNPLTNQWMWMKDTKLSYAIYATKDLTEPQC